MSHPKLPRLATFRVAPKLALRLPVIFTVLAHVAPQSVRAAENLCIGPKFIDAVSTYYNIAIGLAIISAILMTMVGGYFLVVSAGNAGLVERGKKTIFNALFGLGLAILSAVFLNFLNPNFFAPQNCTP